MGKRPRIKVRVGELVTYIEVEERIKKKYGQLIQMIMKENNCSWEEAKKIHRFERVEKNIKREFNLIK